MPRHLSTNVWISNDRRYAAGTSELDMDPDDVAVFDGRDVWEPDDEDLVAHELPPAPLPVVSDSTPDATDATWPRSVVDVVSEPTLSDDPWLTEHLDDLEKPALLAIAEAHDVPHDKRWGVKRLRQAIEDHRG